MRLFTCGLSLPRLQIAIELGKFRFAVNLMEKQLDNEKLRVKNKKSQTLLHAMALNPSCSNLELQKLVGALILRDCVPHFWFLCYIVNDLATFFLG